MNIWILDSNSGVNILYKPFIAFSVNEDLVSGLLTALNQFTKIEFKQELESIEMKGIRWVYISEKSTNLLFIAADTKDVDSEILRARLNVIKQAFIQEYVKSEENWKKVWNGNVEIFRPFENIIEEYYEQWKQAENITQIAEFYDIIGIFQQIFNIIISVIDFRINEGIRRLIFDHVETLFENYLNHRLVRNHPELKKISFGRDSGVNIININPANCNMMDVERQLINLIRGMVEIIKVEVGHEQSVKFFIKEHLFNYILSNFLLLKELNLASFLLKLFLVE